METQTIDIQFQQDIQRPETLSGNAENNKILAGYISLNETIKMILSRRLNLNYFCLSGGRIQRSKSHDQ